MEELDVSQDEKEFSQVITLDDIIKDSKQENDEFENNDLVKPAGMREIIVDEPKHTKYIENPLPVPKKRAHKELDYSILVSDTDDFDIKDLSEMDYYDIE